MNYPTMQDFLENTGTECKRINGLDNSSPSSITLSEKQNRGQGVNKYRNIKTYYNGVVYHSRKEADAARDLDLQQKAGSFDFYLRQVPFNLPGGIIYRADFVTFKHHFGQGYPNWTIKVIEVKGFKTKEWQMKKKLFKETYPNLELEVI